MIRLRSAGVLIAIFSATLLSQSPRETYQRALVEEQAAGNLREAISLYRRAAAEAGVDRELAASALLRAAAAEEKLGDPQAAASYEQILSTYAEQSSQVAVAQSRLAALRRTSTAAVQTNTDSDLPSVVQRNLQEYCVSCHNQARHVANLNFETLLTHKVSENTDVWEKTLQRLRARRDPPAGMPRPEEGTYLTLISLLEVALDQAYPINATLSSAPRVTDQELAERMAALIWGPESRPDGELLDAARRGRLRDAAVLEQQIQRMLKDGRAAALTVNFLEPWLFAGALQRLSESGTRDPRLDAELLSSFMTETRLFLQSQIREDRSALELWTAEYTFVNERLSRLYGIQGVSSTDFRRVSWPDPQRAGILGQGSFLASTSVGDRTSPTIRGISILKLFTGGSPPDPPPNVPAISTARSSVERPMRERLAQHTSVAACTTCHQIFDPLGLVLENFDAIGMFRRSEFNTPIDVSGAFTDGTRFTTVPEFRDRLMRYRDAYYTSVTQSMLGFALGKRPGPWKLHDYEMPAVRAIVREAAGKDYRWSSIIAGIVKSTPFQMKEIVP